MISCPPKKRFSPPKKKPYRIYRTPRVPPPAAQANLSTASPKNAAPQAKPRLHRHAAPSIAGLDGLELQAAQPLQHPLQRRIHKGLQQALQAIRLSGHRPPHGATERTVAVTAERNGGCVLADGRPELLRSIGPGCGVRRSAFVARPVRLAARTGRGGFDPSVR